MTARINPLQALTRRTHRLIVRTTDFNRGQPSVVHRRLFEGGNALFKSFPELGESSWRKVGRRLELRRPRRRTLGRVRAVVFHLQSFVKTENRGGDPVVSSAELRAKLLHFAAEVLFLRVIKRGCLCRIEFD